MLLSVLLSVVLLITVTTKVFAQNPPSTKHSSSLKDRFIQMIANWRFGGSETGLKPGSHTFSFSTKDGRQREYILYVPKSIATSNKRDELPLVVVLHGTYGTGKKMQLGLGFDSYADQHNFLVAYPDAYTENGSKDTARWNDGRETLPSSKLGIDDVAFVQEMIGHINSQLAVKRDAVFVTGASNGGIMTYRLGCQTKGIFKAIAPVIGNIADNQSSTSVSVYDTCQPQAPISVLAINGTADPFIPINGGEVCKGISKRLCEGGWVASRDDSIEKFLVANNCSMNSSSTLLPVSSSDPDQS